MVGAADGARDAAQQLWTRSADRVLLNLSFGAHVVDICDVTFWVWYWWFLALADSMTRVGSFRERTFP